MARPGSLSATPAPCLRIGEVACRTGLPVKTIRYDCDEGLLQPRARSASGYRLFDEQNLAELTIIRALRAMDVAIPELADMNDELARLLEHWHDCGGIRNEAGLRRPAATG